jgi:hypothetical protein
MSKPKKLTLKEIQAKQADLKLQEEAAIKEEQDKLLVAEAPFTDRLPCQLSHKSKEEELLIDLAQQIYATWSKTNIFGGLNSRQKQIFDLLNQGETIELMKAIHIERSK